jgi:hypothetical protein
LLFSVEDSGGSFGRSTSQAGFDVAVTGVGVNRVVVVVAVALLKVDILADFIADAEGLDRVGVVTGVSKVLNGGPFKSVRLPDKLVDETAPRLGRRRFSVGVPGSLWPSVHSSSDMTCRRFSARPTIGIF